MIYRTLFVEFAFFYYIAWYNLYNLSLKKFDSIKVHNNNFSKQILHFVFL